MRLNSKVYDVLKFIAQIGLPAAGTLYFSLAGLWHLPAATEVTGTVVAVDTFLGVLLGLSTVSYNKTLGGKYDGILVVENNEDGATLRLQNVEYESLLNKDEITFKVQK